MHAYNRGGHTKYKLTAHIIFVTKYRKPLLTGALADDVKQCFFDCANEHGWHIQTIETDKDHIHILLNYGTSDSIADIVHNLKRYTTFRLWKTYRNILSWEYWQHNIFWSDGYFVSSIGQASEATIQAYIASQG